ncbi:hypothetical protein CMI37_06330 [Candidatus Pacearchaeota archaeon]|nr:hypothetical protein [Candidatus Pacearchaeota archaeon]|tara:strand:- start:449 stop:1006 length:558 start_codon:yes stop_codon:yes gene_type:complete
MTESTIIHTKLDGELTLGSQCTAGGGSFSASAGINSGADTYTVSFEAGDLSLTIPQQNVSNYLDRGKIGSTPSLRYGDDQPITFSFSAYFRDLTDAAAPALVDIINNEGYAGSNWVSTLSTSIASDDAEVFCIDLRWVVTNQGNAADVHKLVLPFCTVNCAIAEGDPNTVTINGTSWSLAPSVVL